MTSAIGTFAANRLNLQNTLDVESRMQQSQIQLSSGKKAQTFDGIAQDSRRLLDLERTQTANDAFKQNVEQTKLRLDETANALSDMEDVAAKFQAQLVSANTDSNEDKLAIQNTAENLRQEITGLLNTDLAGRQLFSGTAVGQEAIDFENQGLGDVATGDQFKGNGETIEARATDNLEVQGNVTADPGEQSGIQELLTATTRVAEASSDELGGAIQAALDDLNGGQAQVSTTTANDPSQSLSSVFGSLPAPPSAETIDVQNDQTGAVKSVSYDTGDSLREFVRKFNEATSAGADDTSVATARLEDTASGARVVFQSTTSDPISFTTDSANLTDPANLNVAQQQREGAIERLASTNSEVGARQQTLENTLERLNSDETRNELAIGEIENVDITRAANEMSSLQNTLEASLASTARLQNTSILQFLR